MIWLVAAFALNMTSCHMDCVEIKDVRSVEEILGQNKKKLQDFDYQLPTNYAFIYKLASGAVVLIPSMPGSSPMCLVFNDQKCFDDCVANDYFPIENYNRQLEDYDVNSIRSIDTSIQYYHSYLNKKYNMDLSELTRETAAQYYERVSKDRSGDPLAMLALGAVMGEILRKEINGKWVLQKIYGPFNPFYRPMILSGDMLVLVYEKLAMMLEARSKSVFFYDTRFNIASKAVYDQAGITLIKPEK